jgi:VWFA-related protein
MKRRGQWFMNVLILAVCLGLAGLTASFAQRSGPLTPSGPRRAPGPTVAKPEVPKELPPIETRQKQEVPDDLALFSSETNVVSVDVAVLDDNGRFIPKIPQGNFMVMEDGVPQQVQSFGVSQAPMTVALLIEFNARFQQYWSETWYQTLTAAYGFAETLRPEDWVAVIAYDLRSEILSDFTKDRRETYQALQRLRTTGFSEANLFDALTDTCERMSGIEGRKSIVLISTGMDTFSKLNYGEARRIVQEAGVTVYPIGMMQMLRERADAYGAFDGAWGGAARLDFLQADNQLKTFAAESGGAAFFPRFYGEYPSIFQTIHYTMRNQYVLTYVPTNQQKDGEWRKIKVRLIDPKDPKKDLRIVAGKKNKRVKYSVVARSGYRAPRSVE